MIWDNAPGIGRGRRHGDGVTAFTGTLATKLVVLSPHDPESKGLVERRNRWLETSFIPGRTFASPADFNSQLADWLARANTRIVRTTKAAPIELLDADRAAMLPLPPVPLHLGWRNRIRLVRDYYVGVDTCDYWVDPTAIGRIVEVIGDLEQVWVRLDGRPIAEHRRCWARQIGRSVTKGKGHHFDVLLGSPDSVPLTGADCD
ncbi:MULTISPECIES: Mu transposase domain-containing protein [Rhodococcus]|uniref:Mu transposase domain-containing protein n=1 Tax=Rhodococcus TaxID=1827 RepID=UPI001B802565|nr:hypothetical protein [Rhodococcus phenolicus]